MRKALFFIVALLTAATAWAETQTVSYIDADGIEQTVTATVLTGGGATTISTEGWYVVNSDITYTYQIYLYANVNLILADGCTMTLGTSDNRLEVGGIYGNTTLTIYGQTLGTGTLSIYTRDSRHHGIDVGALTINGGHVIADTNGDSSCGLHTRTGDVTINGGTVTATATGSGDSSRGIYATNNFNFTGGKLTVDAAQSDAIWASNMQYNFTWRNFGDQITIGSTGIYTYNNYYHANFSRSFTDGTNIYSGTLTGSEINALKGKTLTPYYADDFAVDGGVYTIHTATGWDLFCDMLEGGETFSSKTVTLADNITVSRMAGSGAGGNLTASDHPFCGTFDGDGNTLTFNYGSSGTPADENNIAPFHYVNNATIQHLHVAGNIYTQHVHAGGIIGMAYGTTNVTDCRSSVNIVSSINGDGTHGGIMSCSWTGSTTNITGCLFDGSIQSAEGYATDQCGGFVGWRNATINVTDCLLDADLSTIGVGTGDYPSATFVRHGEANRITNSYYTSTLGTPQGKQTRSITAGENVTTLENAGTPSTVYNVSGITAYPTGIKYNDVLYAGNDDTLSLTLGHSDIEGYAFNGYEASAGTLSGNDNPYTLTMPDEDVTVTAVYKTSALHGDVNGDNSVDIDDVTTLIAMVLNGNTTPAGDVNGDSSVDVDDVTALIGIILGNS